MKRILILFLPVLTLIGCRSKVEETLMEKLAIEVSDTSRIFSYTNKKSGFYFGETNDYNKNEWQGWNLNNKRILSDYQFLINDKPLDRINSIVTVFPHMIIRKYQSIQEEYFFADSIDLIIIKLRHITSPVVGFKLIGLNNNNDAVLRNNVVNISLGEIIPGKNFYITADCPIQRFNNNINQLTITTEGKDSLTIDLYISSSLKEIKRILQLNNLFISQKEKRIEKLLTNSYFNTNDEEYNKALMWAKISLDALITTDNLKGIWAGLPWFTNNWGRDTFISLPGACLVNGNYKEAKEILLAFVKYQDRNPSSKYYGRIPNRITSNEIIYNTVDGTPWFIIQCYNYFYYTGDLEFLKKVSPSIKLAFEAAVKKSVDQNGFLTHGDQETWMDAVGPNGLYSQRGNRAVEIQALWYKQLIYTSEIGDILKDSIFAKQPLAVANQLKNNFQKYFIDTSKNIIYDRIKSDDYKDASVRPNQFIALNEPDLFTSSIQRMKLLTNAVQSLVFPYGVLSLSQNDEKFHPYHNSPNYPKDEAYHNGIIWQWISGPVVQALCGFGIQDSAWILTSELTHQILEQGAVGTLAELMDAFPREGEKELRLSGTFSQAWSLAEYIRNFYQDYLGVKTDAYHKVIYLLPSLPDDIRDVEFDQNIGNDKVRINYSFSHALYRITVTTISLKDSIDIGAAILNKSDANFQMKTSYHKNDKLVFEVPTYSNSIHDLKVWRNDQRIPISCQIYNEPPVNFPLYQNIRFAVPSLNKELKSLKTPVKNSQ
jgi:glycogen debranching enzyme